MKKAIGYIRVSTERQAQEGVSLENQKERIASYAGFNDLELLGIIADEGISGTKGDRPGFLELLAKIEKREIQHVIVYSLSRFARNTQMTLAAVELMSKRCVHFHSVTEKIDTTNYMGYFFLTIMAGLAQVERDKIAALTKDALQGKKRRGERVGTIPFGFKSFDGVLLVPDEREQTILARMTALRAQGVTFSGIADILHVCGFKTRTGGRFSKQLVHHILKSKSQITARLFDK